MHGPMNVKYKQHTNLGGKQVQREFRITDSQQEDCGDVEDDNDNIGSVDHML